MSSDNSSQNATPGGLPLLPSGWGAGRIQLAGSEDFWQDAVRYATDGGLADQLDAAIHGRAAPRTWVILHEPGEWALAAVTALGFARELAMRDQAVLLLDGDESGAEFTRRATPGETLGWVDMIRYGSGITECGTVLPFSGRRGHFLGVGAYSPTAPTSEEIRDLLRRLQRQGDDVIICAPADSAGRRWATAADLRLLCWDRAGRAAGEVETLVTELAAGDLPLTGLVGFGLPAAEKAPLEELEALVDETVVEEDGAPATDSPAQHTMATEADPEAESDATAPSEAGALGSAASILEGLEREDEQHKEEAEQERMEEEFARRKGSSGLFVWVATAAVVLIAVSAFYYFQFLRVPPDGLFPGVAQEESGQVENPPLQVAAASHDSGLAALDRSLEADNPVDDPTDGLAGTEEQPGQQDVALGSPDSGGEENQGQQDGADAATQEPAVEITQAADDTTADAGATTPEETPAPVVPATSAFDMHPYVHPAGEEGWALHVYSFPDSGQAVHMQHTLAGKGFQSAVRAVEIKDRGRWYRVYLGSFPDKQAANGARSALLKKLGEDWANAVRFK